MTTETPVPVDRSEACAMLGVTGSTFDRLCREGRFDNMTLCGGRALYCAAQLQAYRAAHRWGRFATSVTMTFKKSRKSRGLRPPFARNCPPARWSDGAGTSASPNPVKSPQPQKTEDDRVIAARLGILD
jgi:hypothetical protein